MKIYLVRGYSRESYDDSSFTVAAFESKELAEKAANGLSDVDDKLLALWEVKLKERTERLAEITYLLEEQYEAQAEVICDEYEKFEYYNWDSSFYLVQEIDLIN